MYCTCIVHVLSINAPGPSSQESSPLMFTQRQDSKKIPQPFIPQPFRGNLNFRVQWQGGIPDVHAALVECFEEGLRFFG